MAEVAEAAEMCPNDYQAVRELVWLRAAEVAERRLKVVGPIEAATL